MDKYLVQCDCDGDQHKRMIALIDDDRANGARINLTPNAGEYETGQLSMTNVHNRRGDDQSPVRLHCGGRCRRDIRAITNATAGDIIDKIAPQRSELEVVQWPPHDVLGDGWDSVFGDRNRFAIPFATLCAVNSKLR
jgi:hypothetical protein